MNIDNRVKQIISWPFILVGICSILEGIAFSTENEYLVLLIFPGLFLRKDIFDRELNIQYMAKFKSFLLIFSTIICLISIALLIFVVNNQPFFKFSHSEIAAIILGSSFAVFFTSYELWLFRKYKAT